jgi:hypothetical protein
MKSPKSEPQKIDRIMDVLTKSSGTVQRLSRDMPAKQRGRDGKVLIGGWFDPAVSQQLKILAAERRTTQQKLIEEALNGLFAKCGKPEIA